MYASSNTDQPSWQEEEPTPLLRVHMQESGYASCFAMPSFPQGWAAEMRREIDGFAPAADISPDCRTITGDDLVNHGILSWLVDWYTGPAAALVSTAFSRTLAIPPSLSLGLQLCRLIGPRPGRIWPYDVHPFDETRCVPTAARTNLCGLLFFHTVAEPATSLVLCPLNSWPKEHVLGIREGLLIIFESWRTAYAFQRIAPGHAIYVASLRYVVDPEEPIIAIRSAKSKLFEPLEAGVVMERWERFNDKTG